MKNIHIIGISGGPGAGKSIFTGYAANILTNAGYGVYIVPEAASLLIEAGEKPGSVAFQIKVFTKILKLEASALQEAMMNNSSAPLFILCDRTLLDGNAYCTDEEFLQIATDHGMTLRDICAYYDTILYLETTAKGAPGFYGKQNNKVRYENMQEAKETCDRTFTACSRHPHLIRIYNDAGTFSQKLFKTYQQLCKATGLEIPLSDENARRYYISSFDKKLVESFDTAHVVITQYYLKNENNAHKPPRLRSKIHNNTEILFYTRERQTGEDEFTQVEKIIETTEVDSLLQMSDPTTHKIKKDRYSFSENGNLYELDIFADTVIHKGISGKGILKITPTKQEVKIVVPEIFKPFISKELEPKELTDLMIAQQK